MHHIILPSIAKHAKQYSIEPLKKYSQNFIFDTSLCDKIAKASKVAQNSLILEIGPGTAGLTRSIIELLHPEEFTVIEMDHRCIALLQDIKSIYNNLNIVENDALIYNIEQIAREDKKINIISNLPYQIGTELLIRWLKKIHLIDSITIMLQKEVVDKICANVNSKLYGRLSVISQAICNTEKCFNVSAASFTPTPKIDSAILRLTPHESGLKLTPKIISTLEEITKLAFGQRRKMIKSSLKPLNLDEILKKLNIEQTLRAENLSTSDYINIAKLLD
jgi:16S rRNA (adenine1518-N6/adenine1519-N6)-dimethyltransferase